MAAIISKCCVEDAKQRYQSFAEVLEDVLEIEIPEYCAFVKSSCTDQPMEVSINTSNDGHDADSDAIADGSGEYVPCDGDDWEMEQ